MYINRYIEKQFASSLSTKEIAIVLGARQVGKTSLIQQMLQGTRYVLLNLDILVDKQTCFALRHLNPFDAWKSIGSPDILAIDEAQHDPHVGRMVKGWYDAGVPVNIVLLGSSSLDILDQTAEPLTGRNKKFYLPPLLFPESLQIYPWYPKTTVSKDFYESFANTIQTVLLDRMVFGSYPKTVVTEDKESYVLNVANDYLLKDIFQLGLIKSPETIRKFLLLLAYHIGSEVSTLELANAMSISRLTVERYLELLEQTFIIFRLPSFGKNQRKEIVKNKKIFFWDTGIRNAILKNFSYSPLRPDIGALWENFVISEYAKWNMLTGQKHNLYFWRSRQGSEVDLIIERNGTIEALEIKWSEKKRRFGKAFKNLYGCDIRTVTRKSFLSMIQEKLQ